MQKLGRQSRIPRPPDQASDACCDRRPSSSLPAPGSSHPPALPIGGKLTDCRRFLASRPNDAFVRRAKFIAREQHAAVGGWTRRGDVPIIAALFRSKFPSRTGGRLADLYDLLRRRPDQTRHRALPDRRSCVRRRGAHLPQLHKFARRLPSVGRRASCLLRAAPAQEDRVEPARAAYQTDCAAAVLTVTPHCGRGILCDAPLRGRTLKGRKR